MTTESTVYGAYKPSTGKWLAFAGHQAGISDATRNKAARLRANHAPGHCPTGECKDVETPWHITGVRLNFHDMRDLVERNMLQAQGYVLRAVPKR